MKRETPTTYTVTASGPTPALTHLRVWAASTVPDLAKKYPHARRLRSSWRPLTRPAQPKPPEGDAPPA